MGPFLFLAYINDLLESITNSNVRRLADDCVLYRDITDRNDTDLLQQYLDALGRWETKWLMEFNVGKCFVMHATHSKHRKNTRIHYTTKQSHLSNTPRTWE